MITGILKAGIVGDLTTEEEVGDRTTEARCWSEGATAKGCQ